MKRCVPSDKCAVMYSAMEVVIMTSIHTLCNYFHFILLMSGEVGGIHRIKNSQWRAEVGPVAKGGHVCMFVH